MSQSITIWTYDWVPAGPRGFVRDFRLRWALEEAGRAYSVATVPFDERGPDHLARQSFAQVPFLEDGGIRVFESGACLLHLAEGSDVLMPGDAQGRAETQEWLIAAMNSVEIITLPWWFVGLSRPEVNPLQDWMMKRFERLEAVLAKRQWLAAGRFTVADIMMADVLRIPKNMGQLERFPALGAYVDRLCSRPAFGKAHADQMAHFAAADALRSETPA